MAMAVRCHRRRSGDERCCTGGGGGAPEEEQVEGEGREGTDVGEERRDGGGVLRWNQEGR